MQCTKTNTGILKESCRLTRVPSLPGLNLLRERKQHLIGKPSPLYFKSALEIINAKIEDGFFMLGDDIENDIGAAQKNGGKGILIYTGKTKFPSDESITIKPDFEVNSLKEVISILKKEL